MRKAVIGFLAMAILLFAGTTSAFAAGSRWGQSLDSEVQGAVCSYAGTGCHHGDRDGDGICDFAGTTCFYTHINRITTETGAIAANDSITTVTTRTAAASEEADTAGDSASANETEATADDSAATD